MLYADCIILLVFGAIRPTSIFPQYWLLTVILHGVSYSVKSRELLPGTFKIMTSVVMYSDQHSAKKGRSGILLGNSRT